MFLSLYIYVYIYQSEWHLTSKIYFYQENKKITKLRNQESSCSVLTMCQSGNCSKCQNDSVKVLEQKKYK